MIMGGQIDIGKQERAGGDAASDVDWPANGVESVKDCPVCGNADRKLLHRGLRDRIFRRAPGAWDMQSCLTCGSGYLDPRPTPDSIHLAYEDYHTHQERVRMPAGTLTGLRWLQRVLANGYKNWRFGTDLQPSSRFGILTAFLLPVQRAVLDRQYRHLPRRAGGGRVLDIGFGDGGFLDNAQSMGWDVVGTDFDPEVVENGKRRGFDARLGTVEPSDGPFDVLTMSHVIEHLHDPMAVLRTCYAVLAPGGTLWIETPNVNALGLRRFGADWRGLEPPRHLVLFNRASLQQALCDVGFVNVRDLRMPSPAAFTYSVSNRIRQGQDPYSQTPIPLGLKVEILLTRFLQWFWVSKREFLAVTARKPEQR